MSEMIDAIIPKAERVRLARQWLDFMKAIPEPPVPVGDPDGDKIRAYHVNRVVEAEAFLAEQEASPEP